MDVWDEIGRLRAQLSGAERTLAQVSQRLDQLEARQRPEAKVVRPVAVPPPLPRAPEEKIAPPLPVSVKAATPAPPPPPWMPAPTKTPTKVAESKPPRRFGPPEGMSWEMALGTYWLPRIGIPLIAMAVVYGFTYVAGQYHDAPWMPYARIAAGFTLASALIGIGAVLEKKYPAYARVLMGGGLGVLYFVVFATWYIPQTRIAPSQEFTLVCLALLVTGWGAVAQWRKSQLVALTMTLLGHFTVALSTLTLEAPSRAAVGGLLVLGIGSAWFLYRNGWYAVAMSAMVGSYLNQFFWLAQSPAGGGAVELAAGMAVLVAYLLVYALAERITPVIYAAKNPRLRRLYCGLNTAGFVLLAAALLQGFPFARSWDHLLYFGTALFAAGLGWSYTRRPVHGVALGYRSPLPDSSDTSPRRGGDPISALYYTKASVLVAIGIAVWLDGPTVTLSLALESLVLLLAARQTGSAIGRVLALASAGLAFVHGLYTLETAAFPAFGDPSFYGHCLVALALATVLWGVAEIYRVTPWHTFATHPYTGPAAFEPLCRRLEMLPDSGRQSSRMVIAHALAGFAVLLIAGYIRMLAADPSAAVAAVLLALALAVPALWRRSAPLLSSVALLSGAAVLWWFQHLNDLPAWREGVLLPLALCVLPLLALSELVRVGVSHRMRPFALADDIQGAWQRNAQLIATFYTAAAAAVTVLSLLEKTKPETLVLLAGGAALTATFYATRLRAPNFGLYAVLVILFNIPAAWLLVLYDFDPWKAGLGALLIGAAATGCEKRWWGESPGLQFHRLLPVPYLLYGVFAWWMSCLAVGQFPAYVVPVAMAGLASAMALAMPWLHARAMATISTILIAFAALAWLQLPAAEPTLWWHAGAGVLLLAGLAGDRHFAFQQPFAQPWPGRVLLVCVWAVCTAYNADFLVQGWHSTGSAVIAIGFLAYAAGFLSGTAALLSLLSATLATVPLLLNTLPEMTLAPLCAAFASLIVYWLCAERVATLTLARTQFKLVRGHDTLIALLLTGIPTLLGVVWLTRIDLIHHFYLTLAWTMWALAIFCWALVTHQPWFRYMGLATIGLALGRAFLVDVWQLEELYRAGAMLALGAAVLAIAYGYTRWRASQEPEPAETSGRSGKKSDRDIDV